MKCRTVYELHVTDHLGTLIENTYTKKCTYRIFTHWTKVSTNFWHSSIIDFKKNFFQSSICAIDVNENINAVVIHFIASPETTQNILWRWSSTEKHLSIANEFKDVSESLVTGCDNLWPFVAGCCRSCIRRWRFRVKAANEEKLQKNFADKWKCFCEILHQLVSENFYLKPLTYWINFMY